MTKMQMTLEQALQLVLRGMKDGNIEPAIAILEDVLKQIKENPALAMLRG